MGVSVSNITLFTKHEGNKDCPLGYSLPIPGLRNEITTIHSYFRYYILILCEKIRSVYFFSKFSVLILSKAIFNIHII